jgi:hypothetical protein
LILSLPLLIFYCWELLQRARGSWPSYFLFFISSRLFILLADSIISAFFFGYFFERLRGDTGLKKGAYIATGN